jgi:hypothetical protein
MDKALYLYGITQPIKQRKLASEGIDGLSSVEAVEAEGYLCWVSRVSREEFADELQANMENLEWLAIAGVRHQRVMSEIGAKTTVLPARFGAVFLSDDSLAKDVKRRKPTLVAAFKRLADCEEWGIKVFRTAQPAVAVAMTARSGLDYLKQKAATMPARKSPAAAKELDEFAAKLTNVAKDVAQTGKASAGQPGLEWQASFLLPKAKKKEWEKVLRDYARKWGADRRIDCSGPWPPYSFVEEND